MELISVIVPVYKVEKYLKKCVNSILTQTYSKLEIILVDDGSPDNCGVLCDEYALKDDRIKVIHQENKGLSAARNTGIDASHGDYLCFVDSDDLVTPDYCQVLYDLLKDNDYDFSVCGVCRFEDGDNPILKMTDLNNKVWKSKEFLKEQVNKNSEFGVWNKLYRRSVFSKMRFAEGRLNEDVIWSADLAVNTTNCIETKSQHYCYRQRNSGIVGKQSEKGSVDFLYAGDYLIKTVKDLCPEILEDCLYYAISYPWTFVDKIYVQRNFKANYLFLDYLQKILRNYKILYTKTQLFSKIQKYRMSLFARSKILYGINAYLRLIRMYCCRLINKDPYKNEHWI